MIVLPGGGYAEHAAHEAEPVADWLDTLGVHASVFRYPVHVRHPVPLDAMRAEVRRRRDAGAERVGVIGFSAGGHLAGLAALAPSSDARESPDFVVLGYAITSMETETYRPSRIIALGEDAAPRLRRETSLDALVTPSSPPFFIWHTAEDIYVPPEHTYRLAAALAANDVAHAVHVFRHGPHSLGLAHNAGDVAIWTTLAASWIAEQADMPARTRISNPGPYDTGFHGRIAEGTGDRESRQTGAGECLDSSGNPRRRHRPRASLTHQMTEIEPEPEVVELVPRAGEGTMGEAVRDGLAEAIDAQAAPTTDATHRVRGRDSELTTVGEHLDRLLAGMGTALVIEGPAGMGKSRLLAEVDAMARRLSMQVARGAGDPGDTIVQLAPLMEALHEGPAAILERGALSAAHTSPEQRYWLLQDIDALLERAALEAPIVICLDDLQWADSATAAALRTLPVRLSTVPIGWFLAIRSGPASAEVRAAIDQLERRGAAKLSLRPLDRVAVAQITADLLRAEPDDALLQMATRAGGSPFLLVELVSGLSEEELVRVSAGRAELIDQRVPERVGNSMRRRLDRATDHARRLATVAASLGRRFSLSDVAVMLDEQPSALVEPLEQLLHSSVLVERDGQLAFLHDLTLEAVRTSVPVSVRRALDRQAATVLLAAGALPVEVAMQLAASAEPGDEIAITTLLKAAEMLGSTDPSAAADLSRRALELAPPNHPLRGPLVAGTAVWLHAAARGEEAKSFADFALREVLPPTQQAEVHLSIASMFSLSPDVRAASCRAALALPGLSPELRSLHHALLLHNLVVAGRTAEARAMLEDVREAIAAAGDVGGRFVLELAESGLDYAEGRFARALDMAETGLRTSAAAGDETRAHLTRQWRCDLLAVLDQLDESLALSCEHVAAAQRHRQGWALRIFETGRARSLLQMGRLADAAAILEEQVSEESASQIVNALDAAGVTALARTAIHLGDESSSRLVALIARAMLNEEAPSVRRHGVWVLASQASAAGDNVGAHRWLCTHGEDERLAVLPLFPMDVSDEIRLVRIAVDAHDRQLAEAACQGIAARERQNPGVASIAGAGAHARGILNHDRSELERAVSLFDRSARPLLLAGALEDLGVVCAAGIDTDAAIAALSQSLTLFAETGAAWDAGRLRGRLRTLGVRRRLVTAHRPASGWGSLTDSELAVARLVAEGLTNREVAQRLFVSHHTVSGHLRSVFTKLGVNSRVELTRQVGLHGE